MERIAVFFKLKPGMEKEYKRRHDEIWPEMSELLTAAGIQNYSIWRHANILFGYYETKNNEITRKLLQGHSVFIKWRKEMEEYIYKECGTGKKEWPMELMFLHK